MHRNGPGDAILSDVELSKFVGYYDRGVPRNVILIPEPHPVIKRTETERKAAILIGKFHLQFTMLIQHLLVLTPGLRPALAMPFDS